MTIGIPTYNRQATITSSARSALNQTFQDIRIVISDNASTDGTESICRGLAMEDGRIQYVRHQANLGLTANFNFLFSLARSDYMMILADDDWLEPDYVEQCVRALDGAPGHSVVSGRARWHPSWITGGRGLDVNLTDLDPAARVRRYFATVSDNVSMYGVIRRSALEAALPMENVIGGDWLLIGRLAFQGEVSTLPHTWVNRSGGGMSSDLAKVAEEMQLSWPETRRPHLSLSWLIYQDIALRGPVYAELGRAGRFSLGLVSAWSVSRRYYLYIVEQELAPFLRRRRLRGVDRVLHWIGRRLLKRPHS